MCCYSDVQIQKYVKEQETLKNIMKSGNSAAIFSDLTA